MELDIAYLETNRHGRYLIAIADARNAVKLIEQGWNQITKEKYENPEDQCTRLDLRVNSQKARVL